MSYINASEIKSFENDIISFENNTYNKIKILILFIENHNLINITKHKMNAINNNLSKKELLNIIKNTKELNDYKIEYLLNFTINKSIQELEELYNTNQNKYANTYELIPLKNLNNLYQSNTKKNFTNINTLIIIANKEKKFYIKNNYFPTKNNCSRKKR